MSICQILSFLALHRACREDGWCGAKRGNSKPNAAGIWCRGGRALSFFNRSTKIYVLPQNILYIEKREAKDKGKRTYGIQNDNHTI